jgi:hypothetical protein
MFPASRRRRSAIAYCRQAKTVNAKARNKIQLRKNFRPDGVRAKRHMRAKPERGDLAQDSHSEAALWEGALRRHRAGIFKIIFEMNARQKSVWTSTHPTSSLVPPVMNRSRTNLCWHGAPKAKGSYRSDSGLSTIGGQMTSDAVVSLQKHARTNVNQLVHKFQPRPISGTDSRKRQNGQRLRREN